jgi:large subunit ribosomal protein L15
MSLSLHTIAPARGARTMRFRVGRGDGSGSGKTAGRGTKGQRSRSGGRGGLKLKGLKQMILSFPKLRGFRSIAPSVHAVALRDVAKRFATNESVDLKALKAKGLVSAAATRAKIVGSDAPGKALAVRGIALTEGAKGAIEAAGGSVKDVPKNKKLSSKKKAA